MLRKSERAKKNSKGKSTDGVATEKHPAADGALFSGLLHITLRLTNGTVTLVDYSYGDPKNGTANKNHRKLPARPDHTEEEFSIQVANLLTDSVFIRENKILQRVHLSDIYYIQAMGDYVTIFAKDRKITIHQNLKALEGKLPENRFIRVHRSYMVAFDKIEAIEESTVYINSSPVPVGEAYKSRLMKLLSIIR